MIYKIVIDPGSHLQNIKINQGENLCLIIKPLISKDAAFEQ